jgi:hypothetical protein
MEPYKDLGTFDGLSGFSGAAGKLVRCRYQLREFNDRFDTFVKGHPYTLSSKFEPRSDEQIGDYLFIVESVAVPKREWGVLIGELVHNMRSALDHTIYAAATSPGNKNQFPIFTKKSDWDSKVEPMLHSVPDQVVKIAEEAQPYNAPTSTDPKTHLLAILNRLSNYDKHRLLHTSVMTLQGAAPGFEMGQGVTAIREVAVGFGPLEPGATVVRVTISFDEPDPQVKMYGEFGSGVAFSDPTGRDKVIEGVSVPDVLLDIYRLVDDLVGRIHVTVKPPVATPNHGTPLP